MLAHMQVRVPSAFPRIDHQDLHLPDGKVLDVVLPRTGLAEIALASRAGFEILRRKYAGPANGKAAALPDYARRCLEKPLRRVLLRAIHNHLGAGRRGDLIGKRLTHSLQLRDALKREKKGHARTPGRLQYLREAGIGERRELIEDHAQERLVQVAARAGPGITLANHQLNVLEEYLSQRLASALVLVCIERHEQDHPLLDDFIHRD